MHQSEKQALRRQLRDAYPGAAQRDEESRLICGHVLADPAWQAAGTVAGYVPLRREADVTPLLIAALREGKTLLLPRVEGPGMMTMRRVTALEQLVPGEYGIPAPGETLEVADPATIDLLLVPLEGLDPQGMRLGKGGGFYDRLLTRTTCMTMGVVLSWQWTNRVPADAWDRPLHAAVDYRGVQLFEKGKID